MKSKVLTFWSLIWLLATVTLVVGGVLNIFQRSEHELPPTDGVDWVQKADGVYADKIEPGLAGARAGLIKGDRLIAVGFDEKNLDEISAPADVQMFLETAGRDGNLTYFYQRTAYSFSDNFYYTDLSDINSYPRWTSSIVLLAFVGLVWLAVGLFVLFKQGGNAPFVLHFATVCLAAFVFQVYRPLGVGKDFDLAVGLLDDAAFAFFIPLFLHFCLRYPVQSEVFGAHRWKTAALYLPATIITLGIFILSLFFPIVSSIAPEWGVLAQFASFTDRFDLFNKFYQANLYHFVIGTAIGAGVLLWRFFSNRQPIVRQRLKWAMWGTVAAVFPIVIFQIVRRFVFISGDDSWSTAFTTLPLALIPLSFGHSVVRYRLMDVDVVVRRALVYTITTVAIAAMIGVVALGVMSLAVGDNLSTTEKTLRALIAIIGMAAIVLLSEPLKNFLQERADRFFYGERYDLRQGLLDFGRTISTTSALEPLLNALVNRLQQVLNVQKVAVFIEDENLRGTYKLAKSIGVADTYTVPADFRQMIREKSAERGIVRADELELSDLETSDGKTIVRQELHYYVPCVVRDRMVAVIGLGRAADGSLLSSEDIDILQTIAGYVAVAIENSLLYQEQEQRAAELALLKEFNESIVESINVGLLAVDETGRVTRCNTTFEQMLGVERETTQGKYVEEIFESDFARNLSQILGKSRWHLQELRHGYKVQTNDAHGKPIILNIAVAPLRSAGQEQSGAIIVLENVTSRVKLEETLQQSEKLSSIGLLAAGVAHEVNTPLTGVSSYTQMLLGMIPETDPKHALLLKVQKQTERATNIAGNLLNFSRVGNRTDYGKVDVNKILNDTLQLLEPQLRKSQVTVVKNYKETLSPIYANAGKLQQVFTNLILNARDAMPGGGTISLLTENGTENSVVIEVADTGTGIEPENLGKIYDPFFTTKGVGSGTGLGLAVTYGIVQEHSGTIEAVSRPGEGTIFRLEFPVVENQEQRAVS